MIGIRITGANTTTEACADVLETAVSAGYTHGIGYWADVESLEQNDAKMPMLILYDTAADVKKEFKITVVEIADAINKMLTNPKETDSLGWTERLLDTEHVDGPLADAIVQVACHGKVIYG